MSLAILLLCIIPSDGIISERVDVIELNDYHDPNDGKLLFRQLIFWEWDDLSGYFRVVDFRLVKSDNQIPWSDGDGLWAVVWCDDVFLRKVTSRSFRRTVTLHDPELEDRDCWPKELRRKLFDPSKVIGVDDLE